MKWRFWLRDGDDRAVQYRVLMVCMGNICRSPSAEAVLRDRLERAGLGEVVGVDSAGTTSGHKGESPDPRAIAQGRARGYRLERMRARALTDEDFEHFDLLVAMDTENLASLKRRCPPDRHHRLVRLLDFAGGGDVPDPYYGSTADFDRVLDLIEPACEALVAEIEARLDGPTDAR
jgi:protein-tyrosine phosphatase